MNNLTSDEEKAAKMVAGCMTAIVYAVLSVAIVYWLWNWLMPELLGIHQITFVQAIGIWLLSSALFKSVPGVLTVTKD